LKLTIGAGDVHKPRRPGTSNQIGSVSDFIDWICHQRFLYCNISPHTSPRHPQICPCRVEVETEDGSSRRISRAGEDGLFAPKLGMQRMKAELTLPDFRRTLAVMASRKKQLSREEIHALRGNPWLRKNVWRFQPRRSVRK